MPNPTTFTPPLGSDHRSPASKEIGALESFWGIAGRWQEEDMKEFLAIRGGDLLEYETELVTTKWLFWDTELKHGDKKGTLCKCADEGAVRSCIRAYAKDHADDMYRMPFQTCRDRAKEALGDCCLKVGRKMDTTTRGVLKVEFYK